ncbi:PREDICTED: kinase D-interacting substrate of 220 kDa-like [Tarenaya hassleriana]|uniref:kinase D-interacting substrate of 220 kDa-like n=1 Tax=Tarenaya hassleriana TaxID=28532 RepID=UPI00053C40A3|nr:PREDICTED: kinase D-interacting substrate of 220 kDa-like [Tarenaya hassleriana]
MAPPLFPLRWESTGDQWWDAAPIDIAAANGLFDVVLELLHQDANLLIKLTSLRRIRRLESVWDDGDGDDVAQNRCHVARKLLEECESSGDGGGNSLVRAGYGGRLLYTAASAGDLGFVKKLVGRDPLLVFGEGEYGVTDILYAAARGRNRDVFQLIMDFALLPAGISCEGEKEEEEKLTEKQLAVKEEMAKRGIHGAARGGHVALMEELLHSWRYDIVLGLRDAQGASLLHSASSSGQVEVVEYLISKYEKITNAKDRNGNTALHVAAYKGHLPVVKALLRASPSLMSVSNSNGYTFLHSAVSGFAVSGFKRLDRQMELLTHLASGIFTNVRQIVNFRNNNGKTALHLAVMEGINAVRVEIVELLMKIPGIDLNVIDSDGMTPVDLLQKQRPKSPSTEILIKRLVSAGGRSNGPERGYMPREEYGFCGSPGTLFKISDSEIFLFASPDERDSYDTTNANSVPTKQKWAGSRLKLLLRPAAKREETGKDCDFSGENDWRDGRVTLREMYSRSPSYKGSEGRTISMRSNNGDLPSLSVRMKFTEGLMKGVVVHKTPRFIFSPPIADFSGVSSGYTTPEMSERTDKTPVSMKKQGGSSPRDKKFVNRYLCFGAQGLAMEHSEKSASPSSRLRSFRRAISFVS